MEELKVICDCFIVPNAIRDLDDEFYRDSVENGLYKKPISIKELNNCTENRYIQLWMCNENCDNLNDHAFEVGNHRFEYLSSMIPVEIVRGVKEDGVFEFESIMEETNTKEEFRIKFIITFIPF